MQGLLILAGSIFALLRAQHRLRPGRRLRRAEHAAEFEMGRTTQATTPDGTLVPEMRRILMSLRFTSEGI